MFVRSRSIVRDYNISLFIRGQVHPMKTPGLIGDPSMQCRRTDFRPPTSSLHRPSPCGGYLFKVALSPALLNTHTHPGEFTVEGDPVSSFRDSSESSRIPELPISVGLFAIFFFLCAGGTPGVLVSVTRGFPDMLEFGNS